MSGFFKKNITCDHPETETKTEKIIQKLSGYHTGRDLHEIRNITCEITKCKMCNKTLYHKVIDRNVKYIIPELLSYI